VVRGLQGIRGWISNRRPSWIARLSREPGRDCGQSEDQLSLVFSLVIAAPWSAWLSGLYPANRATKRSTNVSGGGIGLAADSDSGARFAQHGLIFCGAISICARQRNPADKVRAVHQRRTDPGFEPYWGNSSAARPRSRAESRSVGKGRRPGGARDSPR